jgi:hypothetical protein
MGSHRFSPKGVNVLSLPQRRCGNARLDPLRRAGDAALLAVGILITVAAFSTLSSEVVRIHRQALDRRIFAARVAASGQRGYFGFPRAFPGGRADRVCALRRVGVGTVPPYRVCLIVRTSGPVSRRVTGGYRLPPRGKDVRRRRYACFGFEATRGKCGTTAPAGAARGHR